MRRPPFEEFEELFDRFDPVFDPRQRGASRMPVDVTEDGGELRVVADLPGYDTADIDVTVDETELTISAERSAESEADDDVVRRERRTTTVRRTIELPVAVDEDGASASYANGVLTVTLPVADERDVGHRIDVN